MKIRYFNKNDEEVFPKYTGNMDIYYLDDTHKKPVIYRLKGDWLENIMPLGEDDFQYQIKIITFWRTKCLWVKESKLYLTKDEVYEKAIQIYERKNKIKYKIQY